MENLTQFEESIGIKFKDKTLLERVFIHRSYLNEHKTLKLEHNERLEFLGDAVLELAVTEMLYSDFDEPEGVLTNWRSALVKGESLSEEAKKIEMDDFLKTSRGEAKNVGKARDILLANAFEALIGAIYIDQGFNISKEFVAKYVYYKLDNILNNGLYQDAKSKLQEMSQDKYGITPTYEIVSETGPDHNKIFISAVYIGKFKIAEGEGSSKQRSQITAATNALDDWENIENQLK